MANVHRHWNMSFIIVSVVYLACDALGLFVVDSSLANAYPHFVLLCNIMTIGPLYHLCFTEETRVLV